MKPQTQYITDAKGRKKAVILDIKHYEKLLRSIEDAMDKKAIASVAKEKAVLYSSIEKRLKKDRLL